MMSQVFIYNLCAWQHYVADGVVIAAFLIFAILAAKKGFVRCFFGFISTIVALAVAFIFMNAVIGWTDGLFGLQTALNEGCTQWLTKIVGFDVDVSAGGLTAALESVMPGFLVELIVDGIADQTLPQGTTVAMVAGEALGSVITSFVAWLALFLIAKIVLKLVEKLVSSIVESLPIVGAVNSLLGFCVGALQGLLIVSGVVAVLSFIPIDGLTSFFNECVLVNWLYHNNPINLILSWIIKP